MSQTDQETLAAYDQYAAKFARDWHEQPTPTDLQAAVRRFFRPGATADIGCGSGRDTAWLKANGFAAVGYDSSPGLLAEARRLYPAIEFCESVLPDLEGIEDRSFANVLCETVIMHLVSRDIPQAVARLMAILQPGGTLYLTWRTTEGGDHRDDSGRLYSSFEPGLVLGELTQADLLLNELAQSASSGRSIRRIAARKHRGA